MLRFLIFRFRRRRAVSTMIGGMIVLSLLLTALGTMVFVSQQNDQYQQSVNKMGQYDSQQLSENLVFNSPGLTFLTSTAVSGWGSGCTDHIQLLQYDRKQLGGGWCSDRKDLHKFNRVRLHISSAYSTQPSSIAPYAFNQANSFLNPGEVNHGWSWRCRSPSLCQTRTPRFHGTRSSSLRLEGTCFHFNGPFNFRFSVRVSSAFSSGIMKVAYQPIVTRVVTIATMSYLGAVWPYSYHHDIATMSPCKLSGSV